MLRYHALSGEFIVEIRKSNVLVQAKISCCSALYVSEGE